MIERAKRAGYEALIVTVDSAVPGNREYNARNGFALPFHASPRFMRDVARHPGWTLGVMGRYLANGGMPKHENYPAQFQSTIVSGLAGRREEMNHDSLSWDDLARFRDMWPGVLMLKGVNRADDAVRALAYGVDGLIVSNHGGRNMDSAAATLAVLPEIAEAVGERATVLLDSGIRRGSDILKALALGAKGVLTGRATLYGTAVAGEAGAATAIGILKTELDKTMAYTGCRTVDEIGPEVMFGEGAR